MIFVLLIVAFILGNAAGILIFSPMISAFMMTKKIGTLHIINDEVYINFDLDPRDIHKKIGVVFISRNNQLR